MSKLIETVCIRITDINIEYWFNETFQYRNSFNSFKILINIEVNSIYRKYSKKLRLNLTSKKFSKRQNIVIHP